ncbi:hypothetical protein LO762_00005, partial [Actinocorallia sp. API 0066]|uniref:hypothetical protein n=1 Tax=Actinocorallia sp. API 0066 TaxID=2896846 RepID=UPI001E392DA8
MRGDQMPGHQPAQRPGTTGHHHTTSTQTPNPDGTASPSVVGTRHEGRSRNAGETGDLDPSVPDPDLPLLRRRSPLEQPREPPNIPLTQI